MKTRVLALVAVSFVTVGCARREGNGSGITPQHDPVIAALTEDDCKALGGTVSTNTLCSSNKVCSVDVRDPSVVKGFVTKQRCIEVKQ